MFTLSQCTTGPTICPPSVGCPQNVGQTGWYTCGIVGPTGTQGCTAGANAQTILPPSIGCPNTHVMGCTGVTASPTHLMGCTTVTSTPAQVGPTGTLYCTAGVGCPNTVSCPPNNGGAQAQGNVGQTGWHTCGPIGPTGTQNCQTSLLGCATGAQGCNVQTIGCPTSTQNCTAGVGCPNTVSCPPANGGAQAQFITSGCPTVHCTSGCPTFDCTSGCPTIHCTSNCTDIVTTVAQNTLALAVCAATAIAGCNNAAPQAAALTGVQGCITNPPACSAPNIGQTGWYTCGIVGPTGTQGCTAGVGCPNTVSCPPAHGAQAQGSWTWTFTTATTIIPFTEETAMTAITAAQAQAQAVTLTGVKGCMTSPPMCPVTGMLGCPTSPTSGDGCPGTSTCPPAKAQGNVGQTGWYTCGIVGPTGTQGCTAGVGCPNTVSCPPAHGAQAQALITDAWTGPVMCPVTSPLMCPPATDFMICTTATITSGGAAQFGLTGTQGCTAGVGCSNTVSCPPANGANAQGNIGQTGWYTCGIVGPTGTQGCTSLLGCNTATSTPANGGAQAQFMTSNCTHGCPTFGDCTGLIVC